MSIYDIERAARTMPNARVINGETRRVILLELRPRHSRDIRVFVQQARRDVRPESYPPPGYGWRHRKGRARR